MADEAMGPTVTVHMKLAKFDGEYVEGMQPVEVIETSETVPLAEWLARLGGDDHA